MHENLTLFIHACACFILEEDDPAEILQKASVPVLSNTECQSLYDRIWDIYAEQICAG